MTPQRRSWFEMFPDSTLSDAAWQHILDPLTAVTLRAEDGSISLTTPPEGGAGGRATTLGAHAFLNSAMPLLTLGEAVAAGLVFIVRPSPGSYINIPSRGNARNPTQGRRDEDRSRGIANIDWSESLYLGRWLILRTSLEPTKCRLCQSRHCDVFAIRLRVCDAERNAAHRVEARLLATWRGSRKGACAGTGQEVTPRAVRVMTVMNSALENFENLKKLRGQTLMTPDALLQHLVGRVRSLVRLGLAPSLAHVLD